jgi:hypothetical protein
MIRMDLNRPNGCPYATARRMVDEGAADAPVHVFIDGAHCMTLRSLHEAALLTVTEEPKLRRVPWVPHPKATISAPMAALLATRQAARDARKGAA